MLFVIEECAFIPATRFGIVSAFDDEAAESLCLAIPPLSLIAFSSRVNPHTLAMLMTLRPVSHVQLSAAPLELSFALPAVL